MRQAVGRVLVVLAVMLSAGAAAAQHEHIYIYSSADHGGALGADYDFAPAVHVDPRLPFCPGGSCPYSSNSPAFDTLAADLPAQSRFALAAGTAVRFELVAIAAGASMKLGATILDAAGESVLLGAAAFHTHPEWQVVAPEGVEGDWPLTFKLTTTSPGYTQSASYTLTFTNRVVAAPTATPPPTATSIAPTATPTAAPTGVCAPTPLVCGAAGKALFKARTSADSGRASLLFKWLRGTIAGPAAFGEPTSATSYALCVYDDGALVSTYPVAAGGDCGGRPCWKATASGMTFARTGGNAAGISLIGLKHGAGTAKVTVRGSGSALVLPGASPLYSQNTAVTVQLVTSLGSCWGAVLAAPAGRNDGGRFADQAP